MFFVNGPQELYVNLDCLKVISGITLYPTNKDLLIISTILCLVLTCIMLLKQKGPTKGSLLNYVLIRKLLDNSLDFFAV